MINSYDFLRLIIDSLTESVAVIDSTGLIRFTNRTWVEFGQRNACLTSSNWENINYLSVCDAGGAAGDTFALNAAAGIRNLIHKRRGVFVLEYPCHSPDAKRWFLMTVNPTEYQGDNFFVVVHRDITERKQAEEALRIAATAFESHEGMMITDAQEVILRVNHAFTENTGYTTEEVVGKTPRLFKSGRHDAEFYAAMWDTIKHTGRWQGEIWERRKNGEIYPKWLTITAVKMDDGAVTHYVASQTDISTRKADEDVIKNMAFYDPLTRLPNRHLLNDRLSQVVAAGKRSGWYGVLMFLDLDNFKPLNDTHGHLAGDLLLIEAARRLKSCVRDVDTVARFGGDEFVVLLSDLHEDKDESAALAAGIAEKIRMDLSQPYLLAVKRASQASATVVEHHCTTSIGVALFMGRDSDEILQWADAALYQAKEAGRNLVRFHKVNV